jgi:hypothetical protein
MIRLLRLCSVQVRSPQVPTSQKGFAPILLILLVVLVGAGAVLYFNPNFLPARPIPVITKQLPPIPSPSPAESTPSAKPIEVSSFELNLPDYKLEPIPVSPRSNKIYLTPYDGHKVDSINMYEAGPNSKIATMPVIKAYYIANSADKIIAAMEVQNWVSIAILHNYEFSGDVADGVCGGISGLMAVNGNQIRTIDIENYINPCGLDDGSTKLDPKRKGGTYLYVSDIRPIDQVMNSAK